MFPAARVERRHNTQGGGQHDQKGTALGGRLNKPG